MDNQTWKQATLPVRMGGPGIRLTEELALPTFLASVYSVSSLVAQIVRFDADEVTKSAMDKWTAVTSAEMLPPLLRRSQKEWDKTIVEKQFNDLMANFSTDRDKARILAVSQKESGAWLNALPSAALGNLLDDGALRISVAIRLGAVICNPHTCRCGEDVDKFGQHGLKCQKSAGRHRRHWGINDIISRALASADMPNRKEPTGMDRGPKNKRPDGVTSFPWKNGLCLVWDATCRDTLAPSYVANAARNPGSVASGAEIDKANKYRFLEGRYIFQPVGFETLGPWGPAAKKFLFEIGKRIAEKTGERRSTEFLRQRISIEIQRGNAASVLGTLSDSKGLDAVYYLLSNPGHV